MIDFTLNNEQKRKWMNFFSEKTDELIRQWFDLSPYTKDDPYYHEISNNAHATIRLLTIYFRRFPQKILERLMNKIVGERIRSNVSLSIFIRNIHLMKWVIINKMRDCLIEKAAFLGGMVTVDRFFDTYLSCAADQFTKLSKQIELGQSKLLKEMHKDRLTILGQMAASFAHEFRNPLTAIKGFIALLEQSLSRTEQTDHYFSIINKEMKSLETKITQFLSLSKTQNHTDEMAIFDIGDLLREILEFMHPRFIIEGIETIERIPNGLKVQARIDEIKQVLLNLFNNAVEAFHETNGKKVIEIELTNHQDRVVVTLSNNGKPIPEELLDTLFEPFISTKELGTGLGLSICKQIIEKHGGTIYVVPRSDRTAFQFTLPKAHGR